MIRIGIAGLTGAGKSTFANLLAQALPSSIVFHGDSRMKQLLCLSAEKVESLFGKLERGSDGHIYSRNFSNSPERVMETFHVIASSMNNTIMQEINGVPHNIRFVIIEWSFLPLLPIWSFMDEKFIVSTEENIRVARLILRDPRDGIDLDTKRIKTKVKATKICYETKGAVLVHNDGTEDDLKREAFAFAKKIVEDI